MTTSEWHVTKLSPPDAVKILLENIEKFTDQTTVQHMKLHHPWIFLNPPKNSLFLMHRNDLVCWFGFRTDAMGIVEPFMQVTEHFAAVMENMATAVHLLKSAKNFLKRLQKRYRRIEARTNSAVPAQGRLLKHLGFRLEANLPQYGLHNETFQLWSITR